MKHLLSIRFNYANHIRRAIQKVFLAEYENDDDDVVGKSVNGSDKKSKIK